MITVVNKRAHTPTAHDVYIGRPSALGNPFSHKEGTLAQHKVATREEAVARYREWLDEKIRTEDPAVMAALKAIQKDSVLVCWCKPAACHGDVIAEALQERWCIDKTCTDFKTRGWNWPGLCDGHYAHFHGH